MCSQDGYDISRLQPCDHEEADTRTFLHAGDMVRAGFSDIIIRTVDTDVVVLAVAFFHEIKCNHLWLAFETGNHFKYIPAHCLA